MTVEIAAWVIRTIEFGKKKSLLLFFKKISLGNKNKQVSIALFAWLDLFSDSYIPGYDNI